MWDIVLDAFLDTLKLFPFLVVLYILIEVMEHNTGVGKPRKALAGKWGPALGATLGVVPMCGFSVMAAKLYEHRHITLGTLVAVFTATSDEALFVLLLSGMGASDLAVAAIVIGIKFVLGVMAGYVLDLLFPRALSPLPAHHEHGVHDHEEYHEHHEEHHDEHHEGHEEEHAHEEGTCECDELSPCEHKREGKLTLYLWSPLLHALEVAAFVLLVNLAFGLLIGVLGEERVAGFLSGTAYWAQPALCALIGAIPNCASSVVLAQTFALGGIGAGGLLSGLIVNAGLGYLVLFKREKRAVLILAGMLVFGIAAGYLANLLLWLL